MMHQFQREQVKNQLVVPTAIETFPRLELTEGKSEKEGECGYECISPRVLNWLV